ncbi:MAG: DNA polymerase III subunit delta' [Candidatus Buchananbacteria bacterium RIFCSPHIGHO2_02_FULL_38_8]|uniref:DNA polymerase III subunit delta n=2 Tax=Candidatus Buchananiibacteriota TaxID=1817903 RepID=A0A1G1XW51_9BACT|nr:hypothetical protein [uncultured bacterium]OGY44232.1 MAG: DNA polymerase III subunit delta' [Candidatus Buchananbacteria bacterium RIFCSPHIGHO2_01_FULL_39_8]OGY47001.1 MAG: DNA polymerase III subunit delta' [Candidatus Buchananbacteria bacterium RIFCSPHIGHO2_02_FULL_38_8]
MSEVEFNWPIIGHKNIISYLQGNIVVDKVSHAYLFLGPDHIGKTTLAKYFVNSLVCENLNHKDCAIPCGQCKCCQQVINKIHPDIVWVEREVDEKNGKLRKNISIEQIRELQNRLSLHSFLNSFKIAVINEAEHLSKEAANSLLKVLEEPTPKTVLILLTNSISAMPRTVISRCQVIKFLPVSEVEIINYLAKEGLTKKKAKVLAALAYGRPGLAINYLNEPENLEEYRQKIKDFFLLHQNDITNRLKSTQSFSDFSSISLAEENLSVWTKILRDLMLINNSSSNFVGHLNFEAELKQLANLYSNKKLVEILDNINMAKTYLRANVNPRLTLENLILNLPR